MGGVYMKYFKPELWKTEYETPEEEEKTDKLWEENIKSYHERYKSLESRLSKKVFNFFLKKDLHDFQIESLVIEHENKGYRKTIKVTILVTNGNEKWQLSYKGIKKILFDYDINKALSENRGFDDWGYDELLDVDENILSHEILFASETKILIYFKNKNIFVKKI